VLDAVGRGSEEAREELLELVYSELRRIAAARMRRQPPDHTLQPTALLNEAWMRLMGGGEQQWNDRAHFLRAAATAMRSVLVDFARRKAAEKRSDDRARIPLDEPTDAGAGAHWEVLAVNEALEKLRGKDPEKCRLVELRFFCGLSMEETARAMEMSLRKAFYVWEHARAWLYREISR